MTSIIFKIHNVPRNSTGVEWSVSWPGRGIVEKLDNVKTMWDAAWSSNYDLVGLALSSGETYTIQFNPAVKDSDFFLHIFDTVNRFGGITGVGFLEQEQAELFVENMERHITWKLLSKDYDTLS